MHTYNMYDSSCTNSDVRMYSVWNHYHIKIRKNIPSAQTILLDHFAVRALPPPPGNPGSISCPVVLSFLLSHRRWNPAVCSRLCYSSTLSIMLLRFILVVACIRLFPCITGTKSLLYGGVRKCFIR